VQLARARWRVLSNYSGMTRTTVYYKRMTRTTVQLRLKSGLLMTNQIREFWYSCDYIDNCIENCLSYLGPSNINWMSLLGSCKFCYTSCPYLDISVISGKVPCDNHGLNCQTKNSTIQSTTSSTDLLLDSSAWKRGNSVERSFRHNDANVQGNCTSTLNAYQCYAQGVGPRDRVGTLIRI